jgi:predicted nucleotidyltransferase
MDLPDSRAVQNLSLPARGLDDFCRRNHIRRLALFGSVLRADFSAESDVDVLVEYQPGHIPGLAFIDHQEELSNLFGRRVDLNTPASLSRYFRDQVLREAEVIYSKT